MSDYRQEGTGKVITEQQLLKLAAESGFSVEELIQKNNLKLITEDSGNTTGAATTTANVVPTNQAVNTDLTLEMVYRDHKILIQNLNTTLHRKN